jgi:hypothetical protein
MLLLSSSSHADLSIFLDSPAYAVLSPMSSASVEPSTGSAAPASMNGDHPMDGTDQRKEPPPENSAGAPPAELSPAQLSEFESALCALHRSSNPYTADQDGDESMSGSIAENKDPLFFFTTGEWNAFCRQVAAALSRSTYSFQLVECERLPAAFQSMKVELNCKHEYNVQARQNPPETLTADAFKTVFVPKMDSIYRADRMHT